MVVLQIRFGALASCSDGMGVVFIRNAGRRELEQMRSSFLRRENVNLLDDTLWAWTYIFTDNQESDTVRTLSILLSVRLGACRAKVNSRCPNRRFGGRRLTISDALNDPPHRNRSRIKHSRLHSQLPHEVAGKGIGVNEGLPVDVNRLTSELAHQTSNPQSPLRHGRQS
jgi:hypothetical protein